MTLVWGEAGVPGKNYMFKQATVVLNHIQSLSITGVELGLYRLFKSMLIFNQNHKMAHELHEEKIAYLHKYNIHVVVKIKKK